MSTDLNQKNIVWDYTVKNTTIGSAMSDALGFIWPLPDYEQLIKDGLPREVAYWQYQIRKGAVNAYELNAKADMDQQCYEQILNEIFAIRDYVNECTTMASIKKIIWKLRAIYYGSIIGADYATEKMGRVKLAVMSGIAGVCADLMGTEEEMYKQRFVITNEVIHKYAASRFIILKNGEGLSFTGGVSPERDYPEVVFRLPDAEPGHALLISAKTGRNPKEYKQERYSVFSLTPPKQERWITVYSNTGTKRRNNNWDRLKPVKINLTLDEARQVYNEKVDQLVLKEKMKLFPFEQNSEVKKASARLIIMGFAKCTAVHTGDILVKQLKNTGDAFCILSDVTGIPKNCMSADGNLSLSFAAKNVGALTLGAYAGGVIQIREDKGVLAHEWYHAADYCYSGIDRSLKQLFSDISLISEDEDFSYYKRCLETDKKQKGKPYFSLPEEMSARAFEKYIRSKTDNDTLTEECINNDSVYPTDEEMQRYTDAFDKLIIGIRKYDHEKKRQEIQHRQLEQAVHPRRFSGLKLEPKKYTYYQWKERLVRRSKSNPYKGLEYMSEKGWKFLTPEMRQKWNENDMEMLECEEEALVWFGRVF